MLKRICVSVMMCGFFCVSTIGSVVEAAYALNTDSTNKIVTEYSVANEIGDAVKDKVKGKVKEKKEQAKKRVKDSVNKKIDSVLKF